MYQIINLLKHEIVSKLEIIDLIDEEDIQLITIKTDLKDGSILYIREVITPKEDKYSYHWQAKKWSVDTKMGQCTSLEKY